MLGLLAPRRQALAAIGGLIIAAIAVAVAFGPMIRARVAAEAARRRLDISVGSVGLGVFAIRLSNVHVAPKGIAALNARLDEVSVHVGLTLQVSRIAVRGGEVRLDGSIDTIREAWQLWRHVDPLATAARGPTTPFESSGLSVRWLDGQTTEPAAELGGVAAVRDEQGFRLVAGDGRARLGRGTVAFRDASFEVLPTGELARAHARSVVAAWNGVDGIAARSLPGSSTPTDSSPSLAASTSAAQFDPTAPSVALPDLRAFRATLAASARLVAPRMVDSPELGVDSLTWKISARSDSAPLTLGPGPLWLSRSAAQLEIAYTTDARGSDTPLAFRVRVPIEPDDVELTAEGGPVALPLLGIQEGAAGLVDVAHASISGRLKAVLAGDGSALTLDGEAATRAVSLSHPSLASQIVRGIDLNLRVRAVITSSQIRVDDLWVKLGALGLAGSGEFAQTSGHVVGSARFEIPSASCQSILTSFPAALLPTLEGTTMTGTFAAQGALAFDTRALADMRLDYSVADGCRVVSAPPLLARQRFEQAFTHRIYLPDGTTADEVTGPGTPNWTPLDEISPFMAAAVLTTEDGAFPRHHGFNHAAIRAAIVANIRARRFARGASTITMQLAKNLFLSRDKTLSRKLEEVILADYLEQTFSKRELMELYLNVIEFGPGVYGITAAADYFFGRRPAELNLAECMYLSSILPAPLRYATMRSGDQPPEWWLRSLHRLMQIAYKTGQITDAELAEAENETIVFWHGGARPAPRPPVRPRALDYDGSDDDPPAFEPDVP